jgi:hypothetical protein
MRSSTAHCLQVSLFANVWQLLVLYRSVGLKTNSGVNALKYGALFADEPVVQMSGR